jgi:histidyl-tRNA synthetase
MKMKAPRGTHDILPQEVSAWQRVEQVWREHAALYGFREIRTPVFEHTEVFSRGVGDTTDIVQKEMYTFEDKGGRSITLRPENTAGVARAFIEHHMDNQPLPAKLYYLSAPMFRYESPQSGRYRQFYQLGIEAFGAPAPSCDAEVIQFAWAFLEKLGVHNLSLRINSIGCGECRSRYYQELKGFLNARKSELCETCQGRIETNPLRVLDCKNPICQAVTKDAPLITDYLCEECLAHYKKVQAYLDEMEIDFVDDPRIVRGLDYYTKTVFEIVSEDIGAQGTVCGGGRYDPLLKIMGGADVPGIGFAIGMERLLMVMKAAGALEEQENRPMVDVYVASLADEASRMAAFDLALSLRGAGLSAESDHAARSLKAQIKYADRIGAPFVMIIGEDELARGVARVRNMADGSEAEVPLESAAADMTHRLEAVQ